VKCSHQHSTAKMMQCTSQMTKHTVHNRGLATKRFLKRENVGTVSQGAEK